MILFPFSGTLGGAGPGAKALRGGKVGSKVEINTELASRTQPLTCPCSKQLLNTYWVPRAAHSQDLVETEVQLGDITLRYDRHMWARLLSIP